MGNNQNAWTFSLDQRIEFTLLDWSNIPFKHPITNLDSGHYQGGVTTLGKTWLQYSCSITWWDGLGDFNQKQDYFLCTDPWFQTEETRWWGWFSSHSYLVCTRFEWGTLETAPFQPPFSGCNGFIPPLYHSTIWHLPSGWRLPGMLAWVRGTPVAL